MDWTTIVEFIQQPEYIIGVLAGLVLAAILAFLFNYLRRPPESFEAFTNEAGKVLVSRQALQEQIQRCCEELGEVGKARANVHHKNNVLSIRIRLRVKSNAKLVGISGYLQEQIELVLRKNLGIENIGPIDIMVTGILPTTHQDETVSIKPGEKPVD